MSASNCGLHEFQYHNFYVRDLELSFDGDRRGANLIAALLVKIVFVACAWAVTQRVASASVLPWSRMLKKTHPAMAMPRAASMC